MTGNRPEEQGVKVKDAMTPDVLTITPERSLREAAKFMTEHNVGAAVIMDPEQPGPGIITERDLVRSLGRGENPDSEHVKDHLTSRAAFADCDWSLEAAADTMAEGGFRHLVVVEGGDIAGIISMRDIMHVWRPKSD
jgi:CBS domain-containing protein